MLDFHVFILASPTKLQFRQPTHEHISKLAKSKRLQITNLQFDKLQMHVCKFTSLQVCKITKLPITKLQIASL
jgi:hypothetical protein